MVVKIFEAKLRFLGINPWAQLAQVFAQLVRGATKGENVLLWIKITAVPYLIGVCLFASAFAALAVYSIDQYNTAVSSQTLET